MLNLEESQPSLLTNVQNSPGRKSKSKSFKLTNSRNGPIAFLPLNSKIGGQVNNNRPSVGQFLTKNRLGIYIKRQNQVR